MLSQRLAGGALNWYGAYTLYSKEVRRFLKVPAQTVIAPMATTLLFLAVFSLAIGGANRSMAGVPLLNFLGSTSAARGWTRISTSRRSRRERSSTAADRASPLRSPGNTHGASAGGERFDQRPR